jgi:chromosomal replication initiation ATPase DnaA
MIPIPNRKKRKTSEGRKPVKQTYGPDLLEVLNEICDIYKQPIGLVQSGTRKHELVLCRRIFSFACNVLTDATTREIAAIIHKERSNISHHKRSVKKWSSVNDPSFMDELGLYTTNSILWNQYNKTA